MLTWQGTGGFSIDASVRVEGEDRHGVERLVRGHRRGALVAPGPPSGRARPPFALERLHATGGLASLSSPDARLVYRLSKPTPDGRTVLSLSPLELLERLSRLVLPPRIHRHRHHGVLAPNARLRAQAIALGRPQPVEDAEATAEETPQEDAIR